MAPKNDTPTYLDTPNAGLPANSPPPGPSRQTVRQDASGVTIINQYYSGAPVDHTVAQVEGPETKEQYDPLQRLPSNQSKKSVLKEKKSCCAGCFGAEIPKENETKAEEKKQQEYKDLGLPSDV